MVGERQQVQDHQHAGQRVLAVAEIVREVVAAALEHIERLVLDLPARPPASGEVRDGAGADRQVRHKTVVVGPLALGVEHLDGEPRYHVATATSSIFAAESASSIILIYSISGNAGNG